MRRLARGTNTGYVGGGDVSIVAAVSKNGGDAMKTNLDNTYRFKTGDEIVKFIRKVDKTVEPEVLTLAKKYTAISAVTVRDVPDAHTFWLVVGVQKFCIGPYFDTPEEATWNCLMLAKALQTLLETERKPSNAKENIRWHC
jgi:hypothetical protein